MFYLDLEKDNNIVTIQFKECNHSLGQKWAAALRDHLDAGTYVAEPHRIYNLNQEWSEARIVTSLNECIDIVNNYKLVIDYRIEGTMTQQVSNRLHHYFEVLRGENESPNQFYVDAPRDVKNAIQEYNILIHRWEDLGASGRIVVQLKDRPIFPLEDDDYLHWNLNFQPGDIRLNYCHKGKPIWDVFKDGDDVVGDDNIRPQFCYSADFSVGFNKGPGDVPQYHAWWEKMSPKLNQLGFYKNDPKCAVGLAVVGKIIGDPTEIKKEIYGTTKILGVRYD
jgi:hypothetical protein